MSVFPQCSQCFLNWCLDTEGGFNDLYCSASSLPDSANRS